MQNANGWEETEAGFNTLSAVLVGVLVLAIGVAAYFALARHHNTGGTAALNTPAASASAGPSASPGAGGSECKSSSLTASLRSTGAAAGTSYYSLALKNFSTQTCTVTGYPGLSLVDAKGNVLGAPAARNAVFAPQTLTLTHGKSAYAQVRFPNPGNFSPGQCSDNASALKVYPPDQTQALQVSTKLPYCPGFSTSALSPTEQ